MEGGERLVWKRHCYLSSKQFMRLKSVFLARRMFVQWWWERPLQALSSAPWRHAHIPRLQHTMSAPSHLPGKENLHLQNPPNKLTL